jgi:hypothetical protein
VRENEVYKVEILVIPVCFCFLAGGFVNQESGLNENEFRREK